MCVCVVCVRICVCAVCVQCSWKLEKGIGFLGPRLIDSYELSCR